MNAMTGHMRETARRGPDGADAAPVLTLAGISKTFGDFAALNGVDFDLEPGEIHALLGENGAGKSTLMNIVAGIYTPDSGSVSMRGQAVAIRGPSDAQRLGIGMVHQHYKLVKPFTGFENMLLAHPQGSFRQARARMEALTKEALRKIGFEIDLHRPVENLSVSEQQRIEILKVLVAGATVVILDEPTAVLTDAEAARLFAAMRNLAMEGHSVVLVTHKLAEALTYADRITVMRGGKVVRTVLPADISESELTTLIVGSAIDERERRAGKVGRSVLKLRAVERNDSRGGGLRNLNFDVRSGEIYGIAGVGGNGQNTLVEAITGLVSVDAGNIWLDRHGDVTNHPAERMRRYGIACIPSDRQSDALADDLRIATGKQPGFLMRAADAHHLEAADRFVRIHADSPTVDLESRAVAALHHTADGIIVSNAQVAGQRIGLAVGRYAGDAATAHALGGMVRDVTMRVEPNIAGIDRRKPRDRLDQSVLPVAADAGDAVDLA